MNYHFRSLAALAIIIVAIGLTASSPGASSEHLLVINNLNPSGQNTGTVFALTGTLVNPFLKRKATLNTGVDMICCGSAGVVFTRHGSDICVFLGDPQESGGAISAFVYPGFAQTGNFSDPNLTNTAFGIGLAAHGDFLFVSSANNTVDTGNIDIWRIHSGCTIQLLYSYPLAYPIPSMGVTPDGKTLVITYSTEIGLLDSFAISPNGELTEKGPYYSGPALGGLDITADSKYVLFGANEDTYPPPPTTEVEAFAINSDGTLGTQYGWAQLGPAIGTDFIRLRSGNNRGENRFVERGNTNLKQREATSSAFPGSTNSNSEDLTNAQNLRGFSKIRQQKDGPMERFGMHSYPGPKRPWLG